MSDPDDLSALHIAPEARRAASGSPRRRRRGLGYLAAAVVLVLAVLAWRERWFHPGLAVEIATVTMAYPAAAFTLFNATGYVVPQRKADVASKATGRLEAIEVREGSVVTRDQVLARLEDRDLVAALRRVEANVEVAAARLRESQAALREGELNLRRARALVAKKFITAEDHDAAVARHDRALAAVESAAAELRAAQAAREEAQVAVEYTVIRAPFDGVVLRKYADVGDVVAPFASTTQSKGAVVSMADMASLEVEADVSESNLSKTEVGQPCEVQFDALPEVRLRSAVKSIVPTVDRSKATVLVKIGFIDEDRRVLPDMSAKVAFLSKAIADDERSPVMMVPRAALVARDGRDRVWVVHGETVEETTVERGAVAGGAELVIIRGGLKSGDRVVVDPPANLYAGARVVAGS